ncbi:MAG: O-6-methylguanine DNA methyltransferase [Planctomycetota bacterium]|jgi:O-6-methylguanine DNA methyltransferase
MSQKQFSKYVNKIVSAIPEGQVRTYGQVAFLAGSRGAARAVGSMMARNSNENTPCHRVVRSDGSIGEYNGLQGDKEQLLRKEGVVFSGARVDIKKYAS